MDALSFAGQVVDRPRPVLFKSASSSKDGKCGTIAALWGLGNIHNYDEFVRCAALFSSVLQDADRALFSGHLAEVVDTSKALTHAVACGAEGVRKHASMIARSRSADDFGVHRFREDLSGSGDRDEQRISLAITEAFSQFLMLLSSLDASARIARAISCSREQLDEAKNPQDFVVNRALQGGSLPVVVVEFARDVPRAPNDRKEPQLFQYICNNCLSLPDSKCPLSIGVSFLELSARTPTFQIFGYYQVEQNFHVVPITDIVAMDAESLGRLFYTMACFAFNIDEASLPPRQVHACGPVLRFPRGTGGVVTIKDTRVKVFDYADFSPLRIDNGGRGSIPFEQRRTARHGVVMLPDARQARVSESVDVLIYKDVKGDHEPHHTSCVEACVRHLFDAHTKGIIHCDLHLGNCVFNQSSPGESRIIDWDHARLIAEPGKYVQNWNGDLPERHGGSRAGCPIRMAHERHSLGAVLSRFTPCRDDAEIAVAEWTEICEMAQNEGAALNDLADRINKLDVELNLKGSFPIAVTGSPPRDTAAATDSLGPRLSELHLDSRPV